MTDHDDDEYYDDPYEDRYLPGGSPEDAAAIAARWQPPTDGSHAEKLAFMREAAETLPPHMRDAAIAQIEALPTAEEIDAMNAQATALQEATAGLADRRYDGWDQARSTRFTIGFDGEPVELEFTQVAVAARSAHALSAALVESWNAAVANRDEAAVEINREVARITGESR